jgi:hypothetical protein
VLELDPLLEPERAAVDAPEAAAPVEAEVPVEPASELVDDALVVPVAETTSPTCPDNDAIVPLSGACS